MPTTYQTPGVYVEEVSSGLAPISGVGTSTAGFIGIFTPTAPALAPITDVKAASGEALKVQAGTGVATAARATDIQVAEETALAATEEVKLCTNFTEFKKFFADFSAEPGQKTLAHAVYGFFRNGGTRCFVVCVAEEADITKALEKFEAIDEIAIVAAPGVTSKAMLGLVIDHCQNMGDRFAIIDAEENITLEEFVSPRDKLPGDSDYAALYHPWIQVFDPISKGLIFVPPSGHIAGVYARVDDRRGVHKAPANEPILGAVSLKQDISKVKQAPLNADGINCLRNLNGNIRIWGARTLGAGKGNLDFKYINIRRQFNYLRESIDEGTQWVVFEPNNAELWAKIRRNLTAFLMNEWRKGALFGTTPQEAFFVKCDAENNPIDIRKRGEVIAEIGVAVIEPAEFVIFRINQLIEKENQ